MDSEEKASLDEIWTELGNRFDHGIVERYRALAADPERAFATAHEEFRGEVATLSTADHDINRGEAKQVLILAHLLLALLDALRRGRRELNPLPPRRSDWAAEETALLLWAAQHGGSDIRESRAQERGPGERM